MIGLLIVGLALSAFLEEDGPPPDPVTVKVQKCFQGKASERVEACEKAVMLPTSSETHAHLLIAQAIWQEKDRPGSALPLLRMAVDSERSDITSRLVLGWYLDRSGRPGEAREEYREVARLAEGSTENVEMNASVLGVLRESEQDLGPFFRTLAVGFERVSHPKMASAFYSAAILNWREKTDFAQMTTMFEAALKLSPDSPALHVGYADFLRETVRNAELPAADARDRLALAASHMGEAVRLSAEDPRYRYEHARLRLETGELGMAIAEFKEALRLRPDFPDAEHALRLAVLAAGGPGLAVQPAERRDSPEALQRLAECIRLIGTRGRVACNDAIRMGLSAKNAGKAHLYLAEGLDGRRAAEEYRAAIEADPSYAPAYFRLGESQSSAGDREGALESLAKTAELRPEWISAHERLARELEAAGRTPEAIEQLRKAKELEPEDGIVAARLQQLETGGAMPQPWTADARKRVVTSQGPQESGASGRLLQDTGLLIGLADRSSYWIVRQGNTVRVHGPVPTILVSRKTGWWEVTVASSVDFATSSKSSSSFERVVARPLRRDGGSTTTPEEAPCAGREGEEHRSYEIEWVSTEYAGIALDYRIACAGDPPSSARYSYALPLEALRKQNDNPEGIPLPDFGGEQALTAMREGLAVEKLRTAAGFSGQNEKATLSIEDKTWSMKRERGRWFLERPREREGDVQYASFEIPFDAPSKLAGQNELAIGWDAIQEKAPDAVDAFTSPSQDLLVVLTPSRILAFELQKGAVQDRLLSMPIGGGSLPRVVIAEWARGGALEEWNQALLPLFRNANLNER